MFLSLSGDFHVSIKSKPKYNLLKINTTKIHLEQTIGCQELQDVSFLKKHQLNKG
jgi:hypothetical protein